jgi:transcriptional regulator with AAA-type ATPase domain/tetratricopeptide (TPR) repeat protein
MQPLAELLGQSPGIVAVRKTVSRLLQRHPEGRRLPPILIQGATGTGKGLLARAIHRAGPRRDGPFVDLNCAAIPETLLEAELFGFERGAFTDARQAKPGLFQLAHGGTIFLDEIGLLPEVMQGKLLKVIEEQAVRRLGGTRVESVDVWIMAATSTDLAAATRDHRFREDLYHRLAVLTLQLPALRERGDDITLLAEHFLARACADYSLPAKSLDDEACAVLLAYEWPGNVRELANVMERVALLAEEALVTPAMLELPTARQPERGRERVPLKQELGSVEREHLLEALRETDWNLSRAAARLGIPRNTLRYRLEKHRLRPGAIGPEPAPPASASPPSVRGPEPGSPGPLNLRWEPRRLTLLRAAITWAAADRSVPPRRALEALTDKVSAFGGRVVERGLQGLVAAFGLEPVEDAPRRAVHAAVAAQKAADRARAEGEAVSIKLAIHVGRLLVGAAGSEIDIDLDAKLQAWTILDALLAHAAPDTIVVSEAAAPFLERRFELSAEGPLERARGRTYRLVGHERPFGAGPRMAPFIGRRDSLQLLHTLLATAMRGQGQLVGVVGEAGLGKSRLIAEFRQSLADLPVTYREGTCLSYGDAIPYLPVLAILRQNCGVTESDTAPTIVQRVRQSLETLGMNPDEGAPYLLQLLGLGEGTEPLAPLTPEALKLRTLQTLRQMVLNASRQQPIVFVVEDLHWIDRTSEELFAALAEDLPGAPILFLATYRPGYRPPWIERSFSTQVALPPLAPDESRTMMRALLRRDVPEQLERLILDKAEGNPFFLEELCRSVEEQDDFTTIPAVPDTIEALLLARIERLPEETRQLLQTAAVLGREFPLQLLSAVWDDQSSLEPHLGALTGLEFLYQRASRDDTVYVFKHALTQEVAYASLPLPQRRAVHVAAGRSLEALYAGRLDEACGRLAYHYARTEVAPKAVEYLSRFAEKVARNAHEEAVRALKEALQHVERLPADVRDRRHLDLVLRLPYSLVPLGRIEEIQDLLLREHERVERFGDPALTSHYYFLLARTYILGSHDQAIECARRAIAAAERCGDDAMKGRAYSVLALAAALSGRATQGMEDGRTAVALLVKTDDRAWLGDAYWALGLCCCQTAAFSEALAAESQAQAIAETIGDERLGASAAWVTGIVQAAMGECEAAIETCQRAVQQARDALNIAITTGCLGFAYLENGDTSRAIPALEQAIPLLHASRFRTFEAWFTTFLAEAHRRDGRLETAESLAQRALEIAMQAKFGIGMGWAQQALGRIAQTRGDLTAAEAKFEEARRTFDTLRSRYESARTCLDLAGTAVARGDSPAAGKYLAAARTLFATLRVPRYVERTRALADAWGLSLPANEA